MKKTFALVFLLAAFALFAIACGDDDDGPTVTPTPTDNPATPTPTGEPETPTETPTEEPTEEPTEAPTEQPSETPGGLWEHGKRTGVPEVDAILEAWENGDIDALKALVLFQQLECVTEQQGLGGPPKCPEGVPGGTTVDVMPASQCEGYYVYEDGLETLFEGFIEGLNGEEYFLYAAWEDDGDEHTPAGWRIQFAPSVDENIFNPQVVLDEDGKIATYRGGCNPLSLQVPGDADFVLGPKAA